ncbi:MAG: hypothetical protein AAFO69_20285 [Bacteroidota bacterium]
MLSPDLMPFLVIPLVLLVLFIVVRYIIPQLGGWKHLAKHYSTPQEANMVQGEKIRIRQINVGGVNMKNIVLFYKTQQGLFMAQMALFRGHQSNLMIPWDAFTEIRHKKVLFFKQVRLIVGSPEISYLEMSARDFEKIRDRVESNSLT